MERIENSLVTAHNRFLIMYGNGMTDRFITKDYRQVSFKEALWQCLHNQKFECILFFDLSNGIYFLDERSRNHANFSGVSGTPTQDNKIANRTSHFNGPLGRSTEHLKNLQGNRGNKSQAVRGQQASKSPIRDIFALDTMSILMKDASVKTAVIIWQAQNTLRHFDQIGNGPDRPAGATLGTSISDWEELGPDNKNIFLLNFQTDNLAKDYKNHRDYLDIPVLDAHIRRILEKKDAQAVLEIKEPEQQEIHRLIDYIRLRVNPGLSLNWMERARLEKNMAVKSNLIRDWLRLLENITKFDQENIRKLVDVSARHWKEELDDLIGLEIVKEQIEKLENFMLASKNKADESAKSIELPTLHMAFLGNPGTGKTTVARYMGEMFRDLGFLKKGHTVEVRVADLVAGYVGQTAERTRNRIEEAYDGVLFIDEAHQLAEEDGRGFKQEVVDELVPALENERHRLVVIFAGYKSQMPAFFRMDPGLPERVPQRNHIEFPDYRSEELLLILYKELGARGLNNYSERFEKALSILIKNMYDHRPAEFQNARVMRNLAESIDIEYKNRITKQKLSYDSPLSLEDIPEEYQEHLPQTLRKQLENKDIPNTIELMAPLNKLIGLQEVKDLVGNLVNRLIADQARRRNGQHVPRANLHMLFIGNPGTGKTTVARLMGEIFRKLGYLKSGQVHEVTSKDLVAGYVGQSAGQTAKSIEKALDGVLFIDEAYQLRTDEGSQNDFISTAITTLMKAMEDYAGRLVVIAAGYPDEMNKFTESNPGLLRRFGGGTIRFNDFDDEELIEILRNKVSEIDVQLAKETEEKVRGYIRHKRHITRNFGNAGEIDTLFQQMYNTQANRFDQNGRDPGTLKTFTEADIPYVPEEFMNKGKPQNMVMPVKARKYRSNKQ